MHNVKVLDFGTGETLFFGACKFTNGHATFGEEWITKFDVENEFAYWEVELIEGQ